MKSLKKIDIEKFFPEKLSPEQQAFRQLIAAIAYNWVIDWWMKQNNIRMSQIQNL
jgi:hypothetical protein